MEKEPKPEVETIYSLPIEQVAEVDNKIKEIKKLLQMTYEDLERVREETKLVVMLMDLDDSPENRSSQLNEVIELGKLRQSFERAIGEYSRMIVECKESQKSFQEIHESWLEILRTSPKDNPQ